MRRFPGVGAVATSARHQMLIFVGQWRIPFILGVVQPAALLVITLVTPAHVTSAQASRVATGVVLTAFWSFMVWTGAGILDAERSGGTLGACLISVRDTRLVVVGKSLGVNVICGLLILATTSVVLLVLRQPIRFDHPGWYAVGVLAMLLSGLALSVTLSSVFVLTRFGAQISSALMYPVFLLAGLLTPLSDMPGWLRWVSDLISLRWTMTYLSSAASGDPAFGALAMLLVLTVAYAVAGAYAFDRVSRIAREQGTVDLV